MAGIRTSINLIDNMSKVLDRITGKNLKMNDSVEKAQRTMNKSTDFANKLSLSEQKLEALGAQYTHQIRIVARLNEEYKKALVNKGRNAEATETLKGKLLSAQMAEIRLAEAVNKAGEAFEKQQQAEKNLGKGIENATRSQRQFNNEINNGTNHASNLLNKIKGFVGVYLGFRGMKKGFDTTVMAAGELTQRVGVMQAAFGDIDMGRNYFNRLQLYAIETRHSIDDLTDTTRNFMQLTKNTNKLMGLTEMANRLSMRTSNLGSAENLMQEAMRGNFTRLQRTLHLTDAQMAPLKQAVHRGSLDGIIGAFDKALNTAGLTDEIVKAYQNSPLQKFYKVIERAKLGFAMAGEDALKRLEPALDRINSWLQSANADQFFGAISVGISMIVSSVMWLTEIVTNNWNIIQPILLAVTSIYLINITRQLWNMLVPLGKIAMKWMILNWPIMLTVGAVILFIKILMRLGVTADQITGFVGGVFGVLFAYIYNRVAYVWNMFAAFAEFLVNLFIDPKYAIEMLFYNLAMNVLGYFNSMIQGVTGGLNWIVGKINKTLGTDLGTIQVKFMDNTISWLERNKPTSDKNVWEATKMEYKDYAAEFGRGYEWGKQLPSRFSTGLGSIENAISNFSKQEDFWNSMQHDTLGSLDKIGKDLKNSVDKSEEDLKWMRDLAEQEVINRFTTATLAPQLSFEFGDVKETADVDGIVKHIEEILTEQINIAAEGVHV